MGRINERIKRKISNLHYSDMEPFILYACIAFYLFYEYVGDSLPWLQNQDLLPVFTVAVLKLMLNKLDNLADKSDENVGYLTDVIDQSMKKKIRCNILRIFSYDSKGFYHAILGKDFFAEEIIVLIHKSSYVPNDDIVQRWESLVDKKKTNKVTIKLHEFDRIIYGMTFDGKIGIFGSFKPKCIANQNGIASTRNTYSCTSKGGVVSRQLIFDFNDMFDEMNIASKSI